MARAHAHHRRNQLPDVASPPQREGAPRGPVSRILYPALARDGGHLSGPSVADPFACAACGGGCVGSAKRADPVPASPVLMRFDPVKQVLVGVTGVLPEMLPCPLRDPVLLGFRQGTAAPYPLRQPARHCRQVRGGQGPLDPPVHRKSVQPVQGHQGHATGDLGADAPVRSSSESHRLASRYPRNFPQFHQPLVAAQVVGHPEDVARPRRQTQPQVHQRPLPLFGNLSRSWKDKPLFIVQVDLAAAQPARSSPRSPGCPECC